MPSIGEQNNETWLLCGKEKKKSWMYLVNQVFNYCITDLPQNIETQINDLLFLMILWVD